MFLHTLIFTVTVVIHLLGWESKTNTIPPYKNVFLQMTEELLSVDKPPSHLAAVKGIKSYVCPNIAQTNRAQQSGEC